MNRPIIPSASDSRPKSLICLLAIKTQFRALIALTKPLQTLLLLITGVCAFGVSRPGIAHWPVMVEGGLALFLAISGCTVLNMVFDRDIDSLMDRTRYRPLPSNLVTVRSAVALGLVLSTGGLVLAWIVDPLFGLIVSIGFAIDLVVYTLWLKRRTPYSILLGGVSGGMPALAGRVLAIGHVDSVGLLLAASVLLWIPAHTLTLILRHADGYCLAGVPVWPNVYGPAITRRVVAVATLLDAIVMGLAGWQLHIHPVTLGVLIVMGTALSVLAVAALARPSEQRNWLLFKAASLYMLGAFVCLTIGAVV